MKARYVIWNDSAQRVLAEGEGTYDEALIAARQAANERGRSVILEGTVGDARYTWHDVWPTGVTS